MSYRYLTMLYTSLIIMGLGEVAPLSSLEKAFMTLSMIISAFFFSILFSEIASIYA